MRRDSGSASRSRWRRLKLRLELWAAIQILYLDFRLSVRRKITVALTGGPGLILLI